MKGWNPCCWLPVDNYLLFTYNMKIQELLNKHKDKLWDWVYRDILIIEDICYCLYTQEDGREIREKRSLSDLLFSTSFLSLLEWKKCEWYLYRIKQDDQWKVKNIYYDERYHKINLVLLNTDEERVKYIQEFTL